MDMTFFMTASSKKGRFFTYKTKDIAVINLWYITFALYKGDFISDIDKYQTKVKESTKRKDLTFKDLILK